MSTHSTAASWRTLETLFGAGTLGALSDGELLALFRTGRDRDREDAFRTLVERYGPMILRLCRAMVRDVHEAEDAFQATFLVLIQRARSLQYHETLGPWLFAVASRVAGRARTRLYRRRQRERPVLAELTGAISPAFDCLGEDEIILEEIARLPSPFRGPVVLCCLQGLSYDTAARKLGVTEPTVRGRLHRARRRLAARLRERGIDAPAPAFSVETSRFTFPALPATVISSTTHIAMRLSTLGGLLVTPSDISESITSLSYDVNRSILFSLSKVAALVALFTGGVLGAVVLARQANPAAETASISASRRVASQEEKAPGPARNALESRKLTPRQQFEALLTQQEDHLKRIESLRCVIDIRSTLDGGKTWKANSTLKVWRKGQVERVHRSTRAVRAIGAGSFDEIPAPQGEVDVLLAPEGISSMQGFDPVNPPIEPVTVRDELVSGNKIGGLIQPAAPFGPGGHQHALGADFHLLLLPDFQHSLRDFFKDSANLDVKPIERRTPLGQLLWNLDLKVPGGQKTVTLTLSQRHGYSISERSGVPFGALGSETTRVLEFQEPAPGIFLAKTIQSRYTQKPELIVETVIHDVEVNGPIAEKDLAFRFTNGIGVADIKKKVYYIWGDGAPAKTFTTDEYNEWRQRELNKARGFVTE